MKCYEDNTFQHLKSNKNKKYPHHLEASNSKLIGVEGDVVDSNTFAPSTIMLEGHVVAWADQMLIWYL